MSIAAPMYWYERSWRAARAHGTLAGTKPIDLLF